MAYAGDMKGERERERERYGLCINPNGEYQYWQR